MTKKQFRRRVNEMKKSDIRLHYNKAYTAFRSVVIKQARAILKKHPSLHEFVMGMGLVSFTTRKGVVIFPTLADAPKYMRTFGNIICKWDNYLHVTGEPMRFTAKGRIITDW